MKDELFQSIYARRRRAGFSLAETSICTLLVGMLLVAATNSVGASILTQSKTANLVKASSLADSLMSELLALPYMEPGATSSAITRESGESGGLKENYDDLDDFDGWQEQPPRYRDGSVMPNLSNWRRLVSIQWITIVGGIVSQSNAESNIKQINIEVQQNGTTIVTRQALVTNL